MGTEANFLAYHLYHEFASLNQNKNQKMGSEADLADLSSVTFNQDAKSLAVGHATGYTLYNTTNCVDSSNLEFDGDTSPNIHDAVIVERLFNSSLVVIVSRKQPRTMHVYHSQSRNMICDHKFANTILSVKLNRERVIVCLEDCIYVYNLKDMKVMHTICDTPLNRLGLIDLSSSGPSCLMAYPGSATQGNVYVFDAMNLTSVNTFVAHNAPLAALKFNAEGTKLATASSKGTVIRVFSMPNGAKIFEFRRGMTRCATIYSMAFSTDSTFLSTSSNTETVHVFKLEKPEEKKEDNQATASTGWLDYIHKTAATYLPTQMNELNLLERSFATAHLPCPGTKNVVALPTINGLTHLLVATTDGFLYCYKMEPDGGECQLVRQHRIGLTNGKDSPSSSSIKSTTRAPSDTSDPPNPDDISDFPPMTHHSG